MLTLHYATFIMPRNPDRETSFRFKRFEVVNRLSAMKVGTDGVLLGAWVSVDGVATAVDAGCGSGLIALMLAQRGVPSIVGVEIDALAFEEANINVAASPWAATVKVVCADFGKWVSEMDGPVDLIVCNPPFFTETLRSEDSRRAMARHEGSLGVGVLMSVAASVLSEKGCLAMIVPASREGEVAMLAARHGMFLNRLTRVSANAHKPPKRILVELSRCNGPMNLDTLYMRDQSGEFSHSYKLLTSEFYLNM